MAIDYGYFRHRFDASDDPKLQKIVDKYGMAGLGYYFSLLEIFGKKYTQRDDQNRVEIHQRTISNAWRKRADSCHLIITNMELSGLLVVTESPLSKKLVSTKSQHTYLLDIPNFTKYYGAYKKTISVKSPKESKLKEIKVKEKKIVNITKQNPQVVLFNLSGNSDALFFISKANNKTHQLWIDTYQDKKWIEMELLKATTWLLNNPVKNPKSNWGKFLSGWLSRGWENHRKTIRSYQPNHTDVAVQNIRDGYLGD